MIYPNVFLQWNYFVSYLAEISKKKTSTNIPSVVQILAWHRTGVTPLYKTKMFLLSDAYARQKASTKCAIKTEYQWRGNIHVVVNWEQSIHTSWAWLTLANVNKVKLFFDYYICKIDNLIAKVALGPHGIKAETTIGSVLSREDHRLLSNMGLIKRKWDQSWDNRLCIIKRPLTKAEFGEFTGNHEEHECTENQYYQCAKSCCQ